MPVESEQKILNKNLLLISYRHCNKLPQLSGLKPHRFITSQFHRSGGPRGWAGTHTSRGPGGEWSLALFHFWRLRVPSHGPFLRLQS